MRAAGCTQQYSAQPLTRHWPPHSTHPPTPNAPHSTPRSKKKKRDGSLPAHEAKAIVDGLLSAMEVAAEDDMRAYEDGAQSAAAAASSSSSSSGREGGLQKSVPLRLPRSSRRSSPSSLLPTPTPNPTPTPAGKPAVAKLRLLKRVRDVLSTKRLHGELLDGGVLGGERR